MNCKNFTYGVEIEGLFDVDLITRLQKLWDVDLQNDGSVRAGEIFNTVPDTSKIYEDVEEISVGVFKYQPQLMKVLEMIKAGENHFFNNTCGMHLHIKPKKNLAMVEARIADFEFLKKVQKFAFTELCEHVKQRRNNSYCEPYKNLGYSVTDWHRKTKYRFIRSHSEYGTFEMRFFSPCEHKVDNVNKFLQYFFKELREVKPLKQKEIILDDGNPTNMIEDFTLDNSQVTINETHGINQFTIQEYRHRTSHSLDYADILRDMLIRDISRPSPRDISEEHDEENDDCHCDEECVSDRANEGCDCRICTEYRRQRNMTGNFG